jgi:hypothetical protein
MSQNPIKLTVKKDLYTDQINVTQVYGDVDIGISGGYSYVELPEWLRAQVAALDLLPAMERVEGLGYRIGQDFYLVEYNKDCEASSR